jgi:hypothetical protein
VQPTTSEPNEREAFDCFASFYRSIYPLKILDLKTFEAVKNEWQHQQKRINDLEEAIRLRDLTVAEESNQFDSLQAKLNVAVSIINVAKMDANFHSLFALEEKLSKALAEINRIGE